MRITWIDEQEFHETPNNIAEYNKVLKRHGINPDEHYEVSYVDNRRALVFRQEERHRIEQYTTSGETTSDENVSGHGSSGIRSFGEKLRRYEAISQRYGSKTVTPPDMESDG